MPSLKLENTFAKELDGFYSPCEGETFPSPESIVLNEDLVKELSLDLGYLKSSEGTSVLVGSHKVEDSTPLAMAYAGHQFGNFNPRLGDGRALLVGEVLNQAGERFDIHLKGSGRTPYSRGGDGKAVIGPVLREYLMGEFMHALGIPTTRGLAALKTGEQIYRQSGMEPGAVLTRIASSHLRVGTFQFFSYHHDTDKVKQLADYAIARHYPELIKTKQKYLSFFKAVLEKQLALVAKWESIGFIHGVMNTDNTTISGETIDYGPCAFMDFYDRHTVFSSIDYRGRYAYGNQHLIIQWNLARLGETLLALIDEEQDTAIDIITAEIQKAPEKHKLYWYQEMALKLGLNAQDKKDQKQMDTLFEELEGKNIDYTSLFRTLADAARGDIDAIKTYFNSYDSLNQWLEKWLKRIKENPDGLLKTADKMDQVNPLYIPRNHLVEEALDAATQEEDYSLFHELLALVKSPFTPVKDKELFSEPPPEGTPRCITYCGT